MGLHRESTTHGLMLALHSATQGTCLRYPGWTHITPAWSHVGSTERYSKSITKYLPPRHKVGLVMIVYMFLLWESNMSYLILTITQNYLSFHSISVNAVFHQAQQYKLSCLLLFQSSFTVNNCKPFILNLNTFLKQLTSRTY